MYCIEGLVRFAQPREKVFKMMRVRNKENYSFVLQIAVYETLCNRDMIWKSFDAPR